MSRQEEEGGRLAVQDGGRVRGSGGVGVKHRGNRHPGFHLSLLKGLGLSHSEFCRYGNLSIPDVCCGIVVTVQLLSGEVLTPLSRGSLDRGPEGAA